MSSNRFREWYRGRSRPSRARILAHRGDSFRAPENTLEAARLGFSAGADGWELDVRLTADGHPVVIHDESLRRTTNVAEVFAGDDRGLIGFPVSQFTLEELQWLDAGSWFVDERSIEPRSARGFGTIDLVDRVQYGSGSIRIPTLLEALLWTMDVDWLVNVEIKPTSDDSDALVRSVLATIERTRAWNSVTISSFDHAVVESVVRNEPRVATGALISGPLDPRTASWIEWLAIDAVHGPPSSSAPLPARPLLVYTVNDSSPDGLATQLFASGVTGIFTDDPIHFRRVDPINQS